MKFISKTVSTALFSLALGVFMMPMADAHMMVAQHGTLNVVGDGAYMVLSLPVSAFEGIDDDNDGLLSMDEFNQHRTTLSEAAEQNIMLRDMNGDCPLQGIMLSPVAEHETAGGLSSQLIVMGRFALEDPDGPLFVHIGLFGENSSEQMLEITATRKTDSQKHELELTPARSAGVLFPESG